MFLPNEFFHNLFPVLGDELEAFSIALQQPPVSGLRTNTLKIAPSTLRQHLAGRTLVPVPWCPAGFQIDGQSPAPAAPGLGKHPLHTAGLYYLQDPSAMAAAEWLDPQPGERVLDLCGAPGGKATHLAALMGNEGVLVANETVPARAAILAENLERWGVRHAQVTVETPERLAQHWPDFFDRVLVDAPCSGEGMFRRQMANGTHISWSAAQVQGCARRQQPILHHAAKLVRPGGWLLYSTCTFNTIENEETVLQFLHEHPEFELVQGTPAETFATGDRRYAGYHKMARLWPHHLAGEGHFLALLQRQAGAVRAAVGSNTVPATASSLAQRAWDTFCHPVLAKPPSGRLVQTGAYLYYWPEDAPITTGLRVLRPGWWLGELRQDRCTPSHALALALPASHFNQVVALAVDAPEVPAYLRGEPLHLPGPDGWLAVCVEGFVLGWGKRTHGVVKNHFPKGLRWRG